MSIHDPTMNAPSSPFEARKYRLVNVIYLLTALCILPSSTVSAKPTSNATGERIKDIAHIRGVRSNQLFGYGLVVGLNRTGDSQQVRFAAQTVASLLARLNVRISPQGLLLRNIATVMVTAELPPFSKNGNQIDLVVS